jgi:chemotaxis family two-component system response regulator Rcp1
VQGQPIEILLVEDNPVDARLTVEALRDARILNHIHFVDDGEQALAFLRREGKYAEAPRPSVVFLDLNLPKISGHDVLKAMKEDQTLKRIPVIVISSSDRAADVDRAYDEQVSCYIVKPVDIDQYFAAIRSIKELWFHVVTLPAAKAKGNQA